MIEDSCEAGVSLQGKVRFFEAPALRFLSNKQMTTGEAVVVTDDEEIYQLCRSMRNQGAVAEVAGTFGCYNFRMDELNAALGI